MKGRRGNLLAFVLGAACAVSAVDAVAMTLPIESVFRHSIMASDCGFLGRVSCTLPFSVYEWERESLVVVDRPVFGNVSAGDTLRVTWRANQRDNLDGSSEMVACGGDSQLSELAGTTMFWLVAGQEQVRCSVAPIDLAAEPAERLVDLAAYADGQPNSAIPTPISFKDTDALESEPQNLEKCAKVSEFLRWVGGTR